MGGLFQRRHGNLLFLSRSEVLDQVASDIIAGLPASLTTRRPVLIYCGVHKRFGMSWLRRGYKIAIQTEQMYDENGRALWGARSERNRKNIRSALQWADCILDLSAANRRFYDEAGLTAKAPGKVIYGPHIFPTRRISYVSPNRESLIFFGHVEGSRREDLIANLSEFAVDRAETGTYADKLRDQIRPHLGVLNLHFEDGVYTEAPRLLASYLCGKPVVSERLGSEFVAGTHYHLIGSDAAFRAREIFENFADLVSERFTFSGFLRNVLKGAVQGLAT